MLADGFFDTVLAIPNSPMIYLEMKKARKLKIRPKLQPEKGVSTLVDTMVAIELAASWNPLMKSKSRPRTSIMINKVIMVN